MKHDQRRLTTAAWLAVAIYLLGQAPLQSQSTEKVAPRTPWGDPDLQGIWSHATITPLERPAEYGDQQYLTPEEIAAINAASDTRADRREGLTADQDVTLAYNQFWWDRGKSIGRTSLIIDPLNGRLPPRLPAAELRAMSDEAQRIYAVQRGRLPANGPEEMDLGDRCLVYRPVPITSSGYNNHVQIAQTPDYVAIFQEQIHEIRLIPLTERPEPANAAPQWLGISSGHWEDDTLVIETTHFRDDALYLGSSTNRHVIERLTRVDESTIEYEFTVSDPTTWVRPWTGMVPWHSVEGPLYEYACHEGNYGMVGVLRGSRTQDP